MSNKRRKQDKRSVNTHMYIFTEDSVSEINYLKKYLQSRRYNQNFITVRQGKPNTPNGALKNALKKMIKGTDTAWIIFDKDPKDSTEKSRNLKPVFDQATKNGIKIAFSSPCFEQWLLWHYESETPHFHNQQALYKSKVFKKHFPKYRVLSENDASAIIDKIEKAKEVADPIKSERPYELTVYSNFFKLLNAIDTFYANIKIRGEK